MRQHLLLILALLLPARLTLGGPLEHEIAFSEAQVQQALVKAGPQAKTFGGVVRVRLDEAPQVVLGTPENRIGISAHLIVELIGNPPIPVDFRGHAGIRYDDGSKAFYLENPVTESVESQALPRDSEAAARRVVDGLMQNYCRSKPVYTLRNNGSAEELAARWLLRAVRIEPGKVVATLAPL